MVNVKVWFLCFECLWEGGRHAPKNMRIHPNPHPAECLHI